MPEPPFSMMGLHCFIVLITAAQSSSYERPNNITVRVGIVLSERTSNHRYDFDILSPAIQLAFAEAARRYDIHYEVYYGISESECTRSEAVGKATDLIFHDHVQLIVGPGCSHDVEAVGYLLNYYKVPWVTGGGTLLDSTADFPYLSRFSYNTYSQWQFFIKIMQRYNWTNVAIVYNRDDAYIAANAKSLVRQLREAKFSGYEVPLSATVPFQKQERFAWDEVTTNARIVVVLLDNKKFVQFMDSAVRLGYTTNGEYAFFAIDLLQDNIVMDDGSVNQKVLAGLAVNALDAVEVISLKTMESPEWKVFANKMAQQYRQDISNANDVKKFKVTYFVGCFYDAVLMYSKSLRQFVDDGGNLSDTRSIVSQVWNSTFRGVTGDVYIDDDGDRNDDYVLWDYSVQEDQFKVAAEYYGAGSRYIALRYLVWGNGRLSAPVNKPACGFSGDECVAPDHTTTTVAVVCAAIVLLMLLLTGNAIYRTRKETQLIAREWLINWDDLTFPRKATAVNGSLISPFAIRSRTNTNTTRSAVGEKELRSETLSLSSSAPPQPVFHKGSIVSLIPCPTTFVNFNRKMLQEIRTVRNLHHENLCVFIGACVEKEHIVVLYEYCSRGCLQELLLHGKLNLDWMYRVSMANDLANGLAYLHHSAIGYHGRLTSYSCLVDSRFVGKLACFGLPTFFKNPVEFVGCAFKAEEYASLLWTPPELLRNTVPITEKAWSGDVYAFGVILSEIITLEAPFAMYSNTPQEVVERVMNQEIPPFRPRIAGVDQNGDFPIDLGLLMSKCLVEDPAARINAAALSSNLKTIFKSYAGGGNILDNLIEKMNEHAENLEQLVEEKTQQVKDEKQRSDKLLYEILPRPVADSLKDGKPVPPESYESVSIYFSDIEGFTTLSSQSTPLQVVTFLNDLYTMFDSKIAKFDCYKVETIGDAYMVVSGLPVRNGINHAGQIARLSLTLLEGAKNFTIRHKPGHELNIRIGCHSGSCVAGVVGITMPRYCLFGDTVNVASRMESTGEARKIQISMVTKALLDTITGFDVEERGQINVKGKGMEVTFWLLGERCSPQNALDG